LSSYYSLADFGNTTQQLAGLIFDADRQNYTLAVFQCRINNQEAFLNGFRYVYRLKEAVHLDLATFEAISYNSTRNYSQNPVLLLHFVTVNFKLSDAHLVASTSMLSAF
jgi:hypothetical protein